MRTTCYEVECIELYNINFIKSIPSYYSSCAVYIEFYIYNRKHDHTIDTMAEVPSCAFRWRGLLLG